MFLPTHPPNSITIIEIRVLVKVKVKFTLEQATKAQRGVEV
jgi:hypothetical protein